MSIVSRGVAEKAPVAPAFDLPLTLAVVAAFALSLGNLGGLVQGGWWWFVGMASALVVFGTAAAARWMLASRWWSGLISLVALVFTLTLFFAAPTSWLGFIPTADTITEFSNYAEAGINSISAQKVPAVVTPGILVLMTAGIGLVAWLLDLVAFVFRAPVLSGLFFLGLALIAPLINPDVNDQFFLVLSIAAWLVILYVSSPRSRPRDAVAAGAGALCLAIIVQFGILPVGTNLASPGVALGYSTGVNPLLTLGDNLRRTTPETALRYTTDTKIPQYFTFSILDEFDEDGWQPAALQERASDDLTAIAPPPGRSDAIAEVQANTNVIVENISGRWLPIPYAPVSIEGLEGTWRWQTTNQTIRTIDSTMRGQTYTVVSSIGVPSSSQLRASGTDAALGMNPWLEVPDDLPRVIREQALAVTESAPTNYDKAIALQDYFRGGQFTYSEEAPVEAGFDGTDADIIAEFLDAKAGYCVHYASAMAAMARTLGIPARVAVGFVPGKPSNFQDGTPGFAVTTNDLHSWPELHFDGVGWVRFEPTPGRGYVPEYPATVNPTAPPTTAPTPSATPRPTASATARPTFTPQEREEQERQAAAAAAANSERQAPLVAASALLVLLLLLSPAISRALRRARRKRAVRSNGDALAAWSEIVDLSRDLDLAPTTTTTPRELEEAVEGPEAMARLREAAEESVYSRAPGSAHIDDLTAVLAHLRSRSRARTRWRAFFTPRSEFDKWMSRFKRPEETSPA